ncbi:hypothetical protein H70737_07715 [Paenibacillus sp. FSL H7-0737]|nr:hypothetical protein H70737_07715 [Paenibacillus sp. FSL H7-0737]
MPAQRSVAAGGFRMWIPRTGIRQAARCSDHRWPYLPSAGVLAGIPWLPRRWPVRGSTAAAAANTFLVNGKLKRNPTTGLSIGSRKSMLLWTL